MILSQRRRILQESEAVNVEMHFLDVAHFVALQNVLRSVAGSGGAMVVGL
jgi:hypothetical protein